MTDEELLFSLLNHRQEIWAEAMRKYQMGNGRAYPDELKKIDEEIELVEKRRSTDVSTSMTDWFKSHNEYGTYIHKPTDEQPQKIVNITFVRPNEGKKIKVIVNNDYKNVLSIDLTNNKYWDLFFRVAEGEKITIQKNKGFFDYFNSNKSNKLYTNFNLKPQQLLKIENGLINFNVEKDKITEKAFTTRQNKA